MLRAQQRVSAWQVGAALGLGVASLREARLDDKPKLRQVQVCFRHGARTPYRHVPASPEVHWHPDDVVTKRELPLAGIVVQRRHEATRAPQGPPLTQEQVEQIDLKWHDHLLPAVALGERLRKRYVGSLVPESWAEARHGVYVRSTETERTIETAQGVLTGLFPGQVHDAEVELKALGEREWGAATDGRWCPRLADLFKAGVERLKTPATAEGAALLKELRENVDMEVPQDAGAFSISMYRDQLSCRAAHGKPLPKGTDAVASVEDRLHRLDATRVASIFSGAGPETQEESTRLHAGRMLHRIISNLDNADKDPRKLLLFAGHDWTIIMLLLCLDPEGTDPRTRDWPPFCCDLAFELWTQGDRQLVRVLLNGEPLNIPALGAPTHGDKLYLLDDLRAVLDRFVLLEADIVEQCLLDAADASPDKALPV